MIISLIFKCPDCLDNAIFDIPDEEVEKALEVFKKWIKYDEYLTVEIDTETGTCTPIRTN